MYSANLYDSTESHVCAEYQTHPETPYISISDFTSSVAGRYSYPEITSKTTHSICGGVWEL